MHQLLSNILIGGVAVTMLSGCASTQKSEPDPAARMIAQMDAAAPEDRVPHWELVRSRMTRPVPEVGTPAPDFALPTFDGSDVIALAEFEPTKPVVLVFGSWT